MIRRLTPVAFCVIGTACSGWRGDLYVARSKKAEATFRFGQPGSTWRPLRERGFNDVQVAWVAPSLTGVIEIHGQCDEQGDSSLHQYTDHLRIDWTDWKVIQQSEERLVGRAALRTRVRAQLDGVERQSEFVVVKKNGCLFDLRYSTHPDGFEQGLGDFNAVVAGFRFPVRSR